MSGYRVVTARESMRLHLMPEIGRYTLCGLRAVAVVHDEPVRDAVDCRRCLERAPAGALGGDSACSSPGRDTRVFAGVLSPVKPRSGDPRRGLTGLRLPATLKGLPAR